MNEKNYKTCAKFCYEAFNIRANTLDIQAVISEMLNKVESRLISDQRSLEKITRKEKTRIERKEMQDNRKKFKGLLHKERALEKERSILIKKMKGRLLEKRKKIEKEIKQLKSVQTTCSGKT